MMGTLIWDDFASIFITLVNGKFTGKNDEYRDIHDLL